jgi:PASTA domain-containing protein
VIAIAIVFVFGLGTTVFLSLRSPEVKVPDITGKERNEAEAVLGKAGLNFRVRAYRPSKDLKADVVLFQLPRAGEVVKVGQTVAMDLSRPAKEGEAPEAVPEKSAEPTPENQNTNEAPANENKPRPNRNTNRNANENANANNRNANRTPANRNANNSNANNSNANANTNRPANANTNRPPLIINNNVNRGAGTNANVRPPAPRPSATVKPN